MYQGKILLKKKKILKEGFANGTDANNANTNTNANANANANTNTNANTNANANANANANTNANANGMSTLITEINNLEDIFNTKKAEFAASYKALMDNTRTYMNNTNTNSKNNRNVYVNQVNAPENITPSRVGCYQSSGTGLTYQEDLGTSVSVDTCKTRASDLGYSVFALRGGSTATTAKCYVGNDINGAKSAGYAYKTVTASILASSATATIGSLLLNGQLGVYAGSINNGLAINSSMPADPTCNNTTGGVINTNNTIATWGSGCAPPAPVTQCAASYGQGFAAAQYTCNSSAQNCIGYIPNVKWGSCSTSNTTAWDGVLRAMYQGGGNGAPAGFTYSWDPTVFGTINSLSDLSTKVRNSSVLSQAKYIAFTSTGPTPNNYYVTYGNSLPADNYVIPVNSMSYANSINPPNSRADTSGIISGNSTSSYNGESGASWAIYNIAMNTLEMVYQTAGSFPVGFTSSSSQPYNDPDFGIGLNSISILLAKIEKNSGASQAKYIGFFKNPGINNYTVAFGNELPNDGYAIPVGTVSYANAINPPVRADTSGIISGYKCCEGTNPDGTPFLSNNASSYNGQSGVSWAIYEISPQPPSIPIGNWSAYVKSVISGQAFYNFIVGLLGSDPDEYCKKSFNASYSCGNGSAKNISIPAEAKGQTAAFDCSVETAACKGYKLTLGDDGALLLTNVSGGQLWASNAINDARAISSDTYKATNGKYKRNYLNAGETLEMNTFMGSPSGNYYLMMLNNPTTNVAGLSLLYTIFNCTNDANNGLGGSDSAGSDDTASFVYQIQELSTTYLGKVGFINNDGQIQEYSSDMIQPSKDNYDFIGNYDSAGNDLTSFTASNASSSDCETKCSTDDTCAGFVFKKSENTCYMKNTGMFPTGLRNPDSDSFLYTRSKRVSGVDVSVSCPQTMDSSITVADWVNLPTGDKMQMSTLCKLGLVTKNDQTELNKKRMEVNLAASNLQNKLDELVESDMTDVNNLKEQVDRLKKGLKQYNTIKQRIKKQEKTIEGFATFGDNGSKVYKYILFSILAIIVIGTIIKISRNKK